MNPNILEGQIVFRRSGYRLLSKTIGGNCSGIDRNSLGCEPRLRTSWHALAVAVGTTIADRPPHRSVRAVLPHTALTSDAWRRSARWGTDAGCVARESTAGLNRSTAESDTQATADEELACCRRAADTSGAS